MYTLLLNKTLSKPKRAGKLETSVVYTIVSVVQVQAEEAPTITSSLHLIKTTCFS